MQHPLNASVEFREANVFPVIPVKMLIQAFHTVIGPQGFTKTEWDRVLALGRVVETNSTDCIYFM